MTSATDRPTATPAYRITLPRLVWPQVRLLVADSYVGFAMLAAVVLALGGGAFAGITTASSFRPVSMGAMLTSSLGIASIGVQLVGVVLGANAIGGEFSRGTIDSALTVIPRRLEFYLSRALAAGIVAALLAAIAGIVAGGTALMLAALGGNSPGLQVVQAWALGTFGLVFGTTVVTVIVVAIGALARQRVIATLLPIGVLYLAPVLVGLLLPGAAREVAERSLPSTSLEILRSAHVPGDDVGYGRMLPSYLAAGVLLAWAVVIVSWSAVAFQRGDLHERPSQSRKIPQRRDSNGKRSVGLTRATFVGRLRSEALKSWTLPTGRWLIVIAIATELLFGVGRAGAGSIAGVGSTISEGLAIEYSYAITGGVGGLALLTAVLAVTQIASEFETGTAVSTYLSTPRRLEVAASKLLATLVASVILGIVGVLPAAAVTAAIYMARGYQLTSKVLTAGATATVRAVLFVLLAGVISAGIAGISRRSTVTVVGVCLLFTIGPAFFNTIVGVARMAHSPLVAVGNLARLLPWEGARYFEPAVGGEPFVTFDEVGVLQVSPEFGILTTAAWAVCAAIVWLVLDARRPVNVR